MRNTRSRPRTRTSTQMKTSSLSPVKATALLACLWAVSWGIICGIVLYAIGKLPPVVAGFASGIQIVILLVVALFGTVGKSTKRFLRNVWERGQHLLSALLGVGVVTMISVALVFFGQPLNGNTTPSILSNAPATPKTILASTKWHPLLKQTAPNCNNPKGTAWVVHVHGTYLSCEKPYLLMQRISPQYYADMELAQVNDDTYNQAAFHMQVQATFQNPSDTGTLAGLLVQTPAAPTSVGGFLFVLNSTGQWQLQDVLSGTNIPTVEHGTVSIDPSKPVLMTVAVKDGLLVGFINGQPVVWFNDNLNPLPGQIGLEVQGPAPSSPILYSNFELDV